MTSPLVHKTCNFIYKKPSNLKCQPSPIINATVCHAVFSTFSSNSSHDSIKSRISDSCVLLLSTSIPSRFHIFCHAKFTLAWKKIEKPHYLDGPIAPPRPHLYFVSFLPNVRSAFKLPRDLCNVNVPVRTCHLALMASVILHVSLIHTLALPILQTSEYQSSCHVSRIRVLYE